MWVPGAHHSSVMGIPVGVPHGEFFFEVGGGAALYPLLIVSTITFTHRSELLDCRVKNDEDA